MAEFCRSHMIFYQYAIINNNIALSCAIYELFDVDEYCDLEI